jgi:uncharacterized protein YecE (DUF72 family)
VSSHIPKKFQRYLRVGTCSWKYDSWKGLVYDPSVRYRPEDYLGDYARHFRTVEVDQWFWSLFPKGIRLPERKTVISYADSVPDSFIFTVKAPNSITLTHFYAKQPKALASYANRPNKYFLSIDLLERFLDRLSPLGRKLGPIMLQFEYLNRKKMPSRDAFLERLDEFFDKVPGDFQYAIETRNPNYLSKEFFAFLKRRKIGYVFLEGYYMPPIGEVFSKYETATADFGVIRLHGGDRKEMEERTGEKWNRVVAPRDAALSSAAEIVDDYYHRRIHTFVNVNNHFEGSAPLTIDRFMQVLNAKAE